jgi:hypothetical protein
MSTASLYSFTASQKEPVHVVFHSDHAPQDAKNVIPELADVVVRIWADEKPDLSRLRLPHVDYVRRVGAPEDAYRFRPPEWIYDVTMLDGQIVAVRQACQDLHELEKIEQRQERARLLQARIEAAMDKARCNPTYTVTAEWGPEDLRNIRQVR